MRNLQVRSKRIVIATGLTLSVLIGNATYAHEKTRASAPNPQAKAHYNAGVAAAQKREWDKACEEFDKAFKIEPNPQIAANLGHAESKAGRMRSAAEHLDYFLRNDKKATKAAHAEIEEFLDQAKKHIVTVEINVDQAGAQILVAGVEKGISPLNKPLFLEAGEYTFEVRKAGMKAEKRMRVFEKGDKSTITINMVADPAASAQLPINQRGQRAQMSSLKHPIFFTSMGVGIVGLGLALGFSSATFVKYQSAKALFLDKKSTTPDGEPVCPTTVKLDPGCEALNNARTARNAYLGVAFVGYGLIAAGGIGMLAWSLTHSRSSSAKHARINFNASPNAIYISGEF